jgi:hypothetical protein
VADEVRSLQTYGTHPLREPVRCLSEDEPSSRATHLPEARQIDEVNPVPFGDSLHVS